MEAHLHTPRNTNLERICLCLCLSESHGLQAKYLPLMQLRNSEKVHKDILVHLGS